MFINKCFFYFNNAVLKQKAQITFLGYKTFRRGGGHKIATLDFKITISSVFLKNVKDKLWFLEKGENHILAIFTTEK